MPSPSLNSDPSRLKELRLRLLSFLPHWHRVNAGQKNFADCPLLDEAAREQEMYNAVSF